MAKTIILEGLSRTGKTSLSEYFEHEDWLKVSVKNKMPDYVENLPDFYHGMHVISNRFLAEMPWARVIFDRSFLSEIVYSQFFGRSTYINEGEVIDDLLSENDFTLVYLKADHKSYLERAPKDRIVYTEEDWALQTRLFDKHFKYWKKRWPQKSWKKRFIEIDTTKYSVEECYHIIKNQLKK